jgi:hypothetical protein
MFHNLTKKHPNKPEKTCSSTESYFSQKTKKSLEKFTGSM